MSREATSRPSPPDREAGASSESSTGSGGPCAESDFPVASVRDGASRMRHGTHFWWLTLACVIVAVTLVVLSTDTGGLGVTVRFDEGHGIKPGDDLRHKDIAIGRVTAVDLTPALDGVIVRLIVDEDAVSVAREGSRFWIERPRVSLSRVSGLETVVGPKYVEVAPGPADAAPATSFQGLESPPAVDGRSSTTITVHFNEGNGLAPGDVLKFRGIDVGEVTAVRLAEDLSEVEVAVRLVEGAERLARAGSQFWVERPQIRLTEVRGIDTLVGGRYLAVIPGPEGARPLRVFTGLESPPALIDRSEGGLEIILSSRERSGLSPGSPVTYRGIAVGQITSVGLSGDSTIVEARAYIQPAYRRLVLPSSRFWSISGIEVQMGLTGVKLAMDSLSTIAAGGVAMATPDENAQPVATGHRFQLHPEPEEEWLAWRARIALGSTLLPEGASMPHPLRASLLWKERNYVGFTRARQRDGWVLPLIGGRLLGPTDLLSPVEGAIEDTAHLAVAGREFPIAAEKSLPVGRLAVLAVETVGPDMDPAWTLERIRVPEESEDALIVGDHQAVVMPLTMSRSAETEDAWLVDPSMPLDSSWHGASIVSRRDGFLVGVLLFAEERGEIVAVPAEALRR